MWNIGLPGRGHYYIGRVIDILDPATLKVAFEKSDIQGDFSKPIPVPAGNYQQVVKINRTFIKATSLMFLELDPDAPYAIGDRVLVMEDWESHPASKVANDPGGPLEINLFCIGKWRGIRLNDPMKPNLNGL